MKNKKIFIIFIISLIILSSVGSVLAFSHHPTKDERLEQMSWWDRLRYSFSHLQTFTVVHGATCYTNPYTYGVGIRQGSIIACPTTVPPEGGGAYVTNKGCALDIWEGPNYQNWYGEFILNPGDTYEPPINYFTYELYPCPETEVQCLCSGEQDAGCGYMDCPDDMIGRKRICEPAHCDNWYHTGTDISYTCVSKAECEPEICTDQCSTPGTRNCITSNTWKICEDYDSDECLEWSGPNYCPLNYECNFNAGNCEQTQCIDTTWTPDTPEYCEGTGFTQTSNCGRTRTAIGTKTCPTGQTCNPSTHQCEIPCVDTCQSKGYECGIHILCGKEEDCGICISPKVCQNGKCIDLEKCGNNQIDSGEECDGGTYCINCACDSGYESTSPISVNCKKSEVQEVLKASISNIEFPLSAKPGEKVKVSFTAENLGTRGDYLVEVGIVPKETAKDWGFSMFSIWEWIAGQSKTECCEGQENIFAKTVKDWSTGEVDGFTIEIPKAPYEGITDKCYDNKYWDGEGEYVLYFIIKTGCYPEGELVTYETKIIKVEEAPLPCKEPFLHKDLKSPIRKPTDVEIRASASFITEDEPSGDCCEKEGYVVSCIEENKFKELYGIDFKTGIWEIVELMEEISGITIIDRCVCVAFTEEEAEMIEFDFLEFLQKEYYGVPVWGWVIGIIFGFLILSKLLESMVLYNGRLE